MPIPPGSAHGAQTHPCLSAAQAYAAAGLSVIPIRADGTKRPHLAEWKVHQTCRADAELPGWFAPGRHGIAIVCGAISGGVEVIDFEDPDLFEPWRERVEAQAPGLVQRLPLVRTPRPGRHVYYRCDQAEGNKKLARTATGQTLIERKGEGGYVLAPGSPAACHPSGGLYEHAGGPPLTAIPLLTSEERALLLNGARSFDLLAAANKDDQVGKPPGPPPSDTNGQLARPNVLTRALAYLDSCDPAISGQGGHAQTFKVACALAHGFHLDGETALTLLFNSYNPRCVPPWTEKELRHKVESARTQGSYHDMLEQPPFPGNLSPNGSGAAKQHGVPALPHSPVPLPTPPAPLAAAAFHGPAGQLVKLIDPHSEADPATILAQALVAFGTCVGRAAHFQVEGDKHFLNFFATLVGTSSKGRKGSSWGQVSRFFGTVEPDFATDRVKSGLSSGEGLIWAVRDPIWKNEPRTKKGKKEYELVQVDRGVEDKRLLAYESEFASLLKLMERQGNILSPTVRQFWDGTEVVQTLTKNSPAQATRAHVSIIGHVTAEELRRYLSATEQANGFGNRFLWIAAQRSKMLPEGGQLDPLALDQVRGTFQKALAFARSQGAIGFDEPARIAWHDGYAALSEGRPGLAGRMLARAEAQVRRLACVYAVLDLSTLVRTEHLQAALALWEYNEATVFFIFGNSLGDPLADEILLLLQANLNGLTRDDLRQHYQRHRYSQEIARALGVLLSNNLAHFTKNPTGGRSEERWFAGSGPAP